MVGLLWVLVLDAIGLQVVLVDWGVCPCAMDIGAGCSVVGCTDIVLINTLFQRGCN